VTLCDRPGLGFRGAVWATVLSNMMSASIPCIREFHVLVL
jgi:hypothetical protein